METLKRISNGLQKYTTWYYIVPLILLFAFFSVTIDRGPIGNTRLKELSGGLGMLDMQHFGYSETTAYGMLAQIGPAGRTLYTQLLGLDFVFAIIYMLMQSVLLTNLLHRAHITGNWKLLNLLPWLRSALDILENCILLGIIFNFPAHLTVLAFLASAVTVLKWLVYCVVLGLLFSLGAWTTMQSRRSHNKFQKAEKTI